MTSFESTSSLRMPQKETERQRDYASLFEGREVEDVGGVMVQKDLRSIVRVQVEVALSEAKQILYSEFYDRRLQGKESEDALCPRCATSPEECPSIGHLYLEEFGICVFCGPYPIPEGLVCAAGSVYECPATFVCKNPFTIEECPVGFYCPSGSFEPVECTRALGISRSSCRGGAAYQNMVLFAFGTLMIIIAFMCVGYVAVASGRFIPASFLRESKLIEEDDAQSPSRNSRSKKRRGGNPRPTGNVVRDYFIHYARNMEKGLPIDFIVDYSDKIRHYKKRIQGHSIEFRNLTFTIRNKKRLKKRRADNHQSENEQKLAMKEREKEKKYNGRLLNKVTGCFNPGEVTAILGPSGAGKTTLLKALRGALPSGVVKGGIYLNKKKVASLASIFGDTGYVPQDDILYTGLTAQENLAFTGAMFNRRTRGTFFKARPLMKDIFEMLDITQSKDKLVERLSGGQRKRVSIGMELIKEPRLLLLDEPTTGLDAATTVLALFALQEVARRGMTVVLTIHQPRILAFEQLDTVFIMMTGGHVGYYGHRKGLELFLEQIHLAPSRDVNIADYILDVVSGRLKSDAHKSDSDFGWILYLRSAFRHREGSSLKVSSSGSDERPIRPNEARNSNVEGFFITLIHVIHRSSIQYFRSVTTNVVEIILMWAIGVILGLSYRSNVNAIVNFVPVLFQTKLTVGLFGAILGSRVFQGDDLVIKRDIESGLSVAALYFGRLAAQLPRIVLTPFVFSVGYLFTTARGVSFTLYYTILFILFTGAFVFGIFLSFALPQALVPYTAAAFAVISYLFDGTAPSKADVLDVPVVGYPLHYLSFLRAPNYALIALETEESVGFNTAIFAKLMESAQINPNVSEYIYQGLIYIAIFAFFINFLFAYIRFLAKPEVYFRALSDLLLLKPCR